MNMQALVAEAAVRYPIGTKFRPVFTSDPTIFCRITNIDFNVHNEEIYALTDEGYTFTNDMRYGNSKGIARRIYAKGEWADPIHINERNIICGLELKYNQAYRVVQDDNRVWIIRFREIDKSDAIKIFSAIHISSEFFSGGSLWGYEKDIKSIQPATQEENNWLGNCSLKNKFIPNPEYISANIGLNEVALGSPQKCVLGSDKKPVVALPVFLKPEPAKPKKPEPIKLTLTQNKKVQIHLVV